MFLIQHVMLTLWVRIIQHPKHQWSSIRGIRINSPNIFELIRIEPRRGLNILTCFTNSAIRVSCTVTVCVDRVTVLLLPGELLLISKQVILEIEKAHRWILLFLFTFLSPLSCVGISRSFSFRIWAFSQTIFFLYQEIIFKTDTQRPLGSRRLRMLTGSQ